MPDQPASQNALSFTKICVADLERSAKFYMSVIGMTKLMEYQLPGLEEIILQSPGNAGLSLTLMKWTPARRIVVGHEHGRLGVTTSDMPAFFEHARALGAKVTEEPREMKDLGIRVGFLSDPDGYAIEVVQILSR